MIVLASDHGGYDLKEKIKEYLNMVNLEFIDVGCNSNESCDYPDFAHKGCDEISESDMGIFVCGSGNGINMTANSHGHIRGALCWTPEIAELARLHNDANVMCLPGRFISTHDAILCVEKFTNTQFEGGRHENRVNKIKQ